MDQNESLLCHALLSMANFQSQNDSERKEREATYRWFHGLETKVQQNYLSSVPLSEVTIQILQYCLDSPKITSSVESLTAVCFAAIVHRKKSPSNVSNKKVYNRPTCRVSSVHPFDKIINDYECVDAPENDKIYDSFRKQMSTRLKEFDQETDRLFLESLFFDITREGNDTRKNTTTKQDGHVGEVSRKIYRNVAMKSIKSLQDFCNNAFVTMLNEIPVQLSHNGSINSSGVRGNYETSLVFGSLTSFVALDICRYLNESYSKEALRQKHASDDTAVLTGASQVLTMYQRLSRTRKMELLCSLASSTKEVQVQDRLQQEQCLEIYDIISSGYEFQDRSDGATMFIEKIIFLPFVDYFFAAAVEDKAMKLALKIQVRLHVCARIRDAHSSEVEKELLCSMENSVLELRSSDSRKKKNKKKKKKKGKRKLKATDTDSIVKTTVTGSADMNKQKLGEGERSSSGCTNCNNGNGDDENSMTNYESDTSSLTSVSSSSTVTSSSSTSCMALHNVLQNDIYSMVEGLEKLNSRRRALQSSIIIILHGIVSQCWPGVVVEPYGSFATNMEIPSSDVDLLIRGIFDNRESIFTLKNEALLYTQLADTLKRCTWIESVDLILQTKIPVIKIKTAAVPVPDVGFKSLIWIDICIERPKNLQHLPSPRPIRAWPMKSKEFVNKMKDEFKLLKPLCLVLKQFLAHKGLNNAYNGGLSSYGLILMMVHILCRRKSNGRAPSQKLVMKGVMPTFDFGNRSGDRRNFELAEVLLEFLTYYGLEFDPFVNGIGMERGESLITFERRQAYCQGALVVQDPMDPTNNVTAGCFAFSTLQNEFRKAQARIQNRYFEFRAISVSSGSSTKAHTEDKVGDISLLGALFDVPHHENVVRFTGMMWCPPEVAFRKTAIHSVASLESTSKEKSDEYSSSGIEGADKMVSTHLQADTTSSSENEPLQYLRHRNSILAAENDYLKERLKLNNHHSHGTAHTLSGNSFSTGI